jgi:hypothetical protein
LAVGADHERWHGLGVGAGILGTHTGPQHRKPKPKTKSSKSTKAKKKAPPKRAKSNSAGPALRGTHYQYHTEAP